MKDPPRLLGQDALGDGARRVLQAGRRLAPRADQVDQLWVSLVAAIPPALPGGGAAGPPPQSAGGGTTSGGGVASGAGGGNASGSMTAGGAASATGAGTGVGAHLAVGTAVKTGLLGFGAGALMVAAASAVMPLREASPDLPAVVASVSLRPPMYASAHEAPAVVPRPVVSTEPPRPLPSAPAPAVDALAEEARLVARVRRLLRAGEAARALHLLRGSAAHFRRGGLAEERTVLEVEALARLGRRHEAEAVAEDLLREHPRSPHASRVRSVIVDPPR